MAVRPADAAATAAEGRKKRDQLKFVAQSAVQQNTQGVSFVRGVVAGFGAAAVGILGFTGVSGLIAYVLLHLLASFALLTWMAWKPQQFIPQSSVPSFLASGVAENAVLFIFIWTLAYAVVHIY